MTTLRVVLGDQLSTRLEIIRTADRANDVILMAEVGDEAGYVKHHVKKIAFVFAAMRHYRQALTQAGYTVRYVKLDDPENTHSLTGEIERAVKELNPSEVMVTEAGEWRLKEAFEALQAHLSVPMTVLPDTRFLCSHDEFAAWADGKKELRMEFFYRHMRARYNLLMDAHGKPCGGQWNFDKDNRQPPVKGLTAPKRLSFKKDAITREVLDLVRDRFPDNIGRLEPFHFAVTRTQALKELDHFITHCLPSFGTYQDAMVTDEPYLYHSLMAAYINIGFLYPLEVCQKAEAAYRDGVAPLNAAEGFIRQVLGWREYVRGIYWRHMPDYADMNELGAREDLPWFYWDADTKMHCVKQAVTHTLDHAYSHHIQRLMITGNFALLAGLEPRQVHEWYLAVYADAYEWVELPNTLGMALHADGGIMASKPYAAGGNYISKMSNFCQSCHYDVKDATGDRACPFNSLYWDFMSRHRDRFNGHHRLNYAYATWDRMGEAKQAAYRARADQVRHLMHEGAL
ncbi:cryptochrome/photolyase family protein [Asticcacaulis sp. SL142]|uniref:cryptochrome/photolyase family protein n=1 Tax=Asticcacaulis sp. SL142 TaxID=2995155 RepID=UPI00226CD583|nr:cryptochrome/photolyase family protein [Asticcacaulis sp. SL142]WAC46965.1 cryptochrome/photolyase family protein [Asticcacaulis sp. SL142]